MKLLEIFQKRKNIIIGAVHLPPLLSYRDFPGFDIALKNAVADLKAFERGGVDGIIFENNYDVPHEIFVSAPVISSMTFLGEKLRNVTHLPMGVSVLWNDYRTALSIAKVLNLQFIRIPVFVDKVQTAYGIVEGARSDAIDFREAIDAKNVALFTDIHVKHAKLLSEHDLLTSAELAIENKSDAIVITGQWTGDAPSMLELENLRKKIVEFPILVGSGMDEHNAKELFQFANGAIVSTSLKSGEKKQGEVNVKAYMQRIDESKVKKLIGNLR